MKITLVFFYVLFIHLFAFAQESKWQFYFKNKSHNGLLPKLYRNYDNEIHCGFINEKGDSLKSYDPNIKIEALSGNAQVIRGGDKNGKNNKFSIFPNTELKPVILVIKYNNKIVKEQKFEVVKYDEINSTEYYLTINSKNIPIDISKPIPIVRSLQIRYKCTDEDFNKVQGYPRLMIQQFSFFIESKGTKQQIIVSGNNIDLTPYNLTSGTKITLEILRVCVLNRTGCGEYQPIKDKKYILTIK